MSWPTGHTGRAEPWEEVRLQTRGVSRCQGSKGPHLTVVTNPELSPRSLHETVDWWVLGEVEQTNLRLGEFQCSFAPLLKAYPSVSFLTSESSSPIREMRLIIPVSLCYAED